MSAMTRFFVVTFAWSWSFALLQFWWAPSGAGRQVVTTVVGVLFMFGPLLGTLAARRAPDDSGGPLGVRAKPNAWWIAGAGGMLLYAGVTAGVSLCWPSVSFAGDMSGLLERLADVLTPEQLDEARASLADVPPLVLFVVSVLQSLVAGLTVNAAAAFGEELGWRGYLYTRWKHLGFWRSALLIGPLWGIWHAPLILQGHNYPAHPLAGVGMMVLWCTALSPLFHWVRERSGSVIAAAMMHGTLNACAGLSVMYLRGGSDLVVGVTGMAGIVTAAAAGLLLAFVHSRPSSPHRM